MTQSLDKQFGKYKWHPGDRIYDSISGKFGRIVTYAGPIYECIGYRVILDGDTAETICMQRVLGDKELDNYKVDKATLKRQLQRFLQRGGSYPEVRYSMDVSFECDEVEKGRAKIDDIEFRMIRATRYPYPSSSGTYTISGHGRKSTHHKANR